MADVPPPSWTPEPSDPSPYAQAPVPPAEPPQPPARKATAKTWIAAAGAAAVLGLIAVSYTHLTLPTN